LSALPASPETVALFVADLIAVQRRRPATAELNVAAIAYFHRQAELPYPIDKRIRQILAGARRLAPLPEGKAALSADNLRQIVCRLGTSTLHLRNRAILLLGFATALRRENLATLMLEDLQFRPQGVIVQVSKEKTNQNGPPRWIGVYTASGDLCPVAALRTWIDVRGTSPGPLFCHVRRHIQPTRGLTPEQFARIVQHLVRLAGFDPHRYGAHSLRAGFVTAAAEAGVSPLVIMQTTGHRTLSIGATVRPSGLGVCRESTRRRALTTRSWTLHAHELSGRIGPDYGQTPEMRNGTSIKQMRVRVYRQMRGRLPRS
jgi:integrase